MQTSPTGIPATGWWEQYGPIGVLALLAVGALYMAVRHYLTERRAEAAKLEREKIALQTMIDEQRRSLADLNTKLVEVVQRNHTETLQLLDSQRSDHEERFQALLERHILTMEASREKTVELAGSVTQALQSIAKKMPTRGRNDDAG